MKNRFTKEFSTLTTLTGRLMQAREHSEAIRLAEEFNATIEKLIKLNRNGSGKLFERKDITVIYRLEACELAEMDKTFKKEFAKGGNTVRLTKRKLDHFDYTYEIRYRSNNYTITAAAESLDEVKKQFLDMTKTENIKNYREYRKY